MKSRLTVFLLSFFLILAGFEVAMRWNGEAFRALTDPLLLKAAILKKSPETKVLFLGTSRFVDGIEQGRFAEAINETAGVSIRVLNGATTGSQGDRSAYFAELATNHPGLTHVILEASPPALMGGELGFEKESDEAPKPETDPDARKSGFADQLESNLQNKVHEHLALVRYRKSLRPKALLKLPVMLLSDIVDPNLWSRKGVLQSFFTSPSSDSEPELPAEFKPERIAGKARSENQNINEDQLRMMLRLCEIFEDSDLEVIWVAPPVEPSERSENHNLNYTAMYTIAAERYGIEVLDYAGANLDHSFFRDSTHLNSAGRFLFSRILARDLASYFSESPPQN
jgi:hypothetical protein